MIRHVRFPAAVPLPPPQLHTELQAERDAKNRLAATLSRLRNALTVQVPAFMMSVLPWFSRSLSSGFVAETCLKVDLESAQLRQVWDQLP